MGTTEGRGLLAARGGACPLHPLRRQGAKPRPELCPPPAPIPPLPQNDLGAPAAEPLMRRVSGLSDPAGEPRAAQASGGCSRPDAVQQDSRGSKFFGRRQTFLCLSGVEGLRPLALVLLSLPRGQFLDPQTRLFCFLNGSQHGHSGVGMIALVKKLWPRTSSLLQFKGVFFVFGISFTVQSTRGGEEREKEEKKGGGVERGRERLTQKAAFFAAAAQWKVHFSRSKAPPTDSACTPAAWGR